MRKPARIIPWSSTMRTRIDGGGGIAMRRLRLERDVHNNYCPAVLWPFDIGAAAQGGGPLGDRAWGEGRGPRARCDVVRDAQAEMLVATGQRYCRLRAAGVTSHVTEPFRHHLEHLRRQTIMDRERGRGLHMHGDPGRLGKFFG